MNKLPVFVFLCLWTISPCLGQEVAIQQLWLSYETWPDKPTGEDEPWTTPGIVVAFCPDGQFRMASGLLYRAENGAGLGASDGIATFRGEWSGTLMDLTVSYALASAEIQPIGVNLSDLKRKTTKPTVVSEEMLLFDYQRWPNELSWQITLVPAALLAFRLDDRMVKCETSPLAAPNKVLQRTLEDSRR
jgi:hypothetical protein